MNFNNKWITHQIEKETIEWCKYFAKEVRFSKEEKGNHALTTTQLRNFFSEVKALQIEGFTSNENRIIMLAPKLAYAAAKENKKGVKLFNAEFSKMIKLIDNETHFQNLLQIFESVVAYHKVEETFYKKKNK